MGDGAGTDQELYGSLTLVFSRLSFCSRPHKHTKWEAVWRKTDFFPFSPSNIGFVLALVSRSHLISSVFFPPLLLQSLERWFACARGAGVYPSKLILDGPTLGRLHRHVHRPKLSKYECSETGPCLDSRQTTCPIKRPRRKRIGRLSLIHI